MGSRPERGAYGNARGKERQKRRREARLATPRVASALAEVREHQALIDAASAAGEPLGRPTLTYVKEVEILDQKDVPSSVGYAAVRPKVTRKLKIDWNIRDVYLMLDQGYSIEYISKRTKHQYDDVLDDLAEEVYGGESES